MRAFSTVVIWDCRQGSAESGRASLVVACGQTAAVFPAPDPTTPPCEFAVKDSILTLGAADSENSRITQLWQLPATQQGSSNGSGSGELSDMCVVGRLGGKPVSSLAIWQLQVDLLSSCTCLAKSAQYARMYPFQISVVYKGGTFEARMAMTRYLAWSSAISARMDCLADSRLHDSPLHAMLNAQKSSICELIGSPFSASSVFLMAGWHQRLCCSLCNSSQCLPGSLRRCCCHSNRQ